MTHHGDIDAVMLKELYLRLEPMSKQERDAVLNSEFSNNSAISKAVRDLLTAGDHVSDSDFAPLVESDVTFNLEEFPSRVGPYRIDSLIGRGGMACVFRATQERPIERTVALKLLRSGFDTSGVLSRFETERHTLARLQHRNIAKVFDAGADPYGPSWFAMELVDGPPITEYCRRPSVDFDAILRLFSQVCLGVQHAHMRGVLHRDLKPSNILVIEEDGQPEPKIIDFGVAKALGADTPLSNQTHTLDTQLVGTLEYMSPEQARFGNPDVDARSDVYALGVILFELLTGSLPLNRDTLNNKPFDEIQRLIQTKAPSKPSAIVSSLPPEFDCVILKALEKDPADRYQTAKELSDEINRFLLGKPLAARSPSRLYVFSKFARRNKFVLGVTGLLALLVIGGLLGTSVGLYRERLIATELAETVDMLQQNKLELQQALKDAEELGSFTSSIFFGIRPEREGRDTTLREALAEAARSIESSESPVSYASATLAGSLMDPLWTLGEYELSESMASIVIAWSGPGNDGRDPALTCEATLRRAHARARLGMIEETEADFVEAVRLADLLGGVAPELRYRSLVSLGEWLDTRARYREGLTLKLEALRLLEESNDALPGDIAIILGQIGRTYSQLGEKDLAVEYAERGLIVRESASTKNDLQILSLQRTVAIVAMDAGNYKKAVEILEPHVPAVVEALGAESTGALYSGTLLGSARARLGIMPAEKVLAELSMVVDTAQRVTPPRLHLFLRAYHVNAMVAYDQIENAVDRGDLLITQGEEIFGPASDQQFQLRTMLATELAEFKHWQLAQERLEVLLEDLLEVRSIDDALMLRVRSFIDLCKVEIRNSE